METKKCGDCFHADVCEEADTLVGFSRENPAYCGIFLDNADVVEVVHGRWVLLAEFFDGSICTECSVCGEEYTYKKGRLELVGFEYAKYNYCPNCGAKMDGDKHE